MPAPLPEGRYLSVAWMVRAVSGGQTRAMLLRNCAFSAATGRPADVLTIDAYPEYDQLRRQLQDDGLLGGGMQLLNLYEHYRTYGWGDEVGTGAELEPVRDLEVVECHHPDGSWWRRVYRDAAHQVVLNDWLRPDGSVYLRAAPYHIDTAEQLPTELIRVSTTGEVLGRYTSLTQWCHRWFADLTVADDRTFLFTDSRQLVPVLAPIDDPSIHLVYEMHNCHLPGPRRWNTPLRQDFQRCLESIAEVDAFVTLTQRQREDIELRWGPRDNVAVVPNPVDLPAVPQPVPERDPNSVVLLGRLEKQKRITHAIGVFERVVAEVPDARLDVYGSGRLREKLQTLIDDRGLAGHITLHGHDPLAREALWTASAFLLTSEWEGYPLSTLESMSRGCPVVGYDIPYGPREQITDGVDGFLVPDEDLSGAAKRLVQLLSAPELVERMGRAGREKAALHSEEIFLDQWAQVLQGVLERAPRRTRLTTTELSLFVRTSRVGLVGPWRLKLSGQLDFGGVAGSSGPRGARLTLALVDETTGRRTPLTLTARQSDWRFDFEAALDLRRVTDAIPAGGQATLRLCLSWENSHWETSVTSDQPVIGPGLQLSSDGVLLLGPRPT